ncbi:MAG: Holliday junction branch migration DNA helicase RuvB, partial [Bacteroidales bacterium]|nr:Holliday junction branch migration DNA helicase RuvB [Bacteroidales bacterium]
MGDSFDIRESRIERDTDFEKALRPVRFDDFSGQEKIIENLRVFVAAARMRGEALDH